MPTRTDRDRREELARLADEQAALRRVATLVARDPPPAQVFAAVAEELGRLLGAEVTTICRYEADRTVTVVAEWGDAAFPVGTRLAVDDENVGGLVLRTGRVARVDDYSNTTGSFGSRVRQVGLRSAVGCPVVVDGKVWGVTIAASRRSPSLPAATETRIAQFTELVATAISNTEARTHRQRLADEQAALRRVATLVARGVAPGEVFAAVAEEVARLLPVDFAVMGRYDADSAVTVIAACGALAAGFAVGSRWPLEGDNLARIVLETGRPARIDDYADATGELGHSVHESGVRSAVAAPITFEGRVWAGIAVASSGEHPMPADTESRLMHFAELAATAISNAQARAEVHRLADEQAALRRVATLVARGVPPDEVFAAVTEEVGRLLGTGLAGMARYNRDDTVTVLAAWAAEDGGEHPTVPGPWPLEGGDLASTVATTGRSVRIDSYDGVPGRIAAFVRDELGIKASVASPIIVGGRLWGVLFVHSRQTEPLPRDTESHLTDFTELVATAIANADARAALAASRARVVAAADETRRRIERDLHDGIQQRLLSLMLELQSAEVIDSPEVGELRAQLARTADGMVEVLDELREISRGIHPAILSNGGLVPAIRGLARRQALPVELDLRAEERLPELVEIAAYYVVSEALTNAAKHAQASVVNVELGAVDSVLRLAIRDDGVGGADPGQGSGLIGLSDRIEALGGTLEVTSRAGDGTAVLVEIPMERGASGA